MLAGVPLPSLSIMSLAIALLFHNSTSACDTRRNLGTIFELGRPAAHCDESHLVLVSGYGGTGVVCFNVLFFVCWELHWCIEAGTVMLVAISTDVIFHESSWAHRHYLTLVRNFKT